MTRTVCLVVCFFLAATSLAERPTAMRLFPEETVLFVRVGSADEVSQRASESLGGRLIDEPEVAPLIDHLYSQANDAFIEQFAEATDGASIDKLRMLLRGEVAFGLMLRKNQPMAFLGLVDTNGDPIYDEETGEYKEGYRPDELVGALHRFAEKYAVAVGEEDLGGHTAVVFRPGENQENSIGVVVREGVLLVSNDKDLLASALARWDGFSQDEENARFKGILAENEAFARSVRECIEERIGGDEVPPDIIGYVDPVGVLRAAAQDNMGLRIALATLPTLGLDGVEGAAGASWTRVGGWDSIARAHLLLENPRSGVLRMLRLQQCDLTPSEAVPDDVLNYMVFSADFASILDKAGQLHDLIRGEGTFAKNIEAPVEKTLGVSLREIFALTTGRIEKLDGFGASEEGKAPRVSAENLALFELNDPEAASAMLHKIFDKFEKRFIWEEHLGIEYARLTIGQFNPPDHLTDEQRERRRRQREGIPRPAFAVVGDQLVIAQSYHFLHRVIEAHEGETPRLADSLPYKLVRGRVERLTRSSGPSEGTMLFYSNPAEQIYRWIEGFDSEQGRQHLDDMASIIPPFRALRDALVETGMPSQETLEKYIAPSGAVVYDTPSGFRFVTFQFDRAEEE